MRDFGMIGKRGRSMVFGVLPIILFYSVHRRRANWRSYSVQSGEPAVRCINP
jgi:hypothetical protein